MNIGDGDVRPPSLRVAASIKCRRMSKRPIPDVHAQPCNVGVFLSETPPPGLTASYESASRKQVCVEFLIVCPLALIAGMVDAVAGGGGLISLPAFIFAGLPVHNAIATNKLASTMGTTLATIRYALSGYMVKRFVVAGVVCGLSGSTLGSNLALMTDDGAFKAIMLVILPFVAFFVLRTKNLDAFANRELPRGRALAITAAAAFLIGIYDGFYGPGTGTFLMLALTALAHQDVRTAAGTTKAINLSTNAAALAVFIANGAVLFPLGLAAGAFNIVGNWIGSSSFMKRGSSIARPVMLVVIVLFAARLVFDLFA